MNIYIDAAFHPKVKDASIVAVIKEENATLIVGQYIDNLEDNHVAEFKALQLVLWWLVDQKKQNDLIVIHSDSQLVVDSVMKQHVKDPRYDRIFEEICGLIDQFSLLFVKWISEKENRQADQLAKQVLRKRQNWPFN